MACPDNLHRPGLTTPCGLTGPKSDFWAQRFYLSPHTRHAEYNSSEIDKTLYCQPSRWTEKGGPMARAEPEVVFRGPITFSYLVLC